MTIIKINNGGANSPVARSKWIFIFFFWATCCGFMSIKKSDTQCPDTNQTPWSQLRANQRKGLQGKSLRKYCSFHELSRNIVYAGWTCLNGVIDMTGQSNPNCWAVKCKEQRDWKWCVKIHELCNKTFQTTLHSVIIFNSRGETT